MCRYILLALCIFATPVVADPILLKGHDESTVRTVLVEEIPSLTVDSITLISSGWDNLVAEVNGDWIFRFPRSEAFISTLEREQKLLNCLHENISIPIPYYEFVGARTSFVGYRKIPGAALEEELYLSLTEDVRQEVAETLSLFLTQLHNAVDIEEALDWGYREYRVPHEWIRDSLIGTLPSPEIERIITEALEYSNRHPNNNGYQVLLHNDLHGGNFAFDVNTQKVTGVFDFSDAVIGDYSIEFGKLFNVHHDLAIRTADAYARQNSVSNPIIPAAVDFILRRATYILHARDESNLSREQSLIRMLDRFIPVWDEILLANDVQQLFQ